MQTNGDDYKSAKIPPTNNPVIALHMATSLLTPRIEASLVPPLPWEKLVPPLPLEADAEFEPPPRAPSADPPPFEPARGSLAATVAVPDGAAVVFVPDPNWDFKTVPLSETTVKNVSMDHTNDGIVQEVSALGVVDVGDSPGAVLGCICRRTIAFDIDCLYLRIIVS